jgi:hypothetical protein
MKRARKAPDIPLTRLRLSDLCRDPLHPDRLRLVNLKVPADTLLRVHDLAHKLKVTKAATIIALLNEGIQEAQRRGVGRARGMK